MHDSSFFTLAALIAGAIAASLNIYALSAGADFGGGVWDLLASGSRRDRQRALVADAIGPIWEANHVWLILVIVLLFTAFPPAFALLMTLLHVPMTLMLIGIVLRGSAFTFRSYDSRRDSVQRRWGRIFAIASTATPVLLGCIVGAIATGELSPAKLATHMTYADSYVWPWLRPFPIGVGLLSLALFAFLAAVYLTVEAKDDELREDFRRRALIAAAIVVLMALLDLVLARSSAPLVWSALTKGSFATVLRFAAAAAAVGAMYSLWRRQYRAARIATIVEVSLILWGWALGQFPLLVPPAVTVEGAAAPVATLRLLIIALLVGLAVLVPSLRYLFEVFKARST
ncbi:MAG TPA: cytochrome d ubiquinol oxidase subunit II [Gemmatimonadaceae bacterium]|nr:cytochrome d ubiquinol oxidase subunit II [Gemmatimonadaceae bacterium]